MGTDRERKSFALTSLNMKTLKHRWWAKLRSDDFFSDRNRKWYDGSRYVDAPTVEKACPSIKKAFHLIDTFLTSVKSLLICFLHDDHHVSAPTTQFLRWSFYGKLQNYLLVILSTDSDYSIHCIGAEHGNRFVEFSSLAIGRRIITLSANIFFWIACRPSNTFVSSKGLILNCDMKASCMLGGKWLFEFYIMQLMLKLNQTISFSYLKLHISI